MSVPLIECIPNFSEGRDPEIIRQIIDAISSASGVKVLHSDPGYDTNRTVVTFAGRPEDVVEGAFRGIRKAALLIDMRKHKGAHPRMGATDVCPLVPLSGIGMEETAEWARKLAKRVGEELGIPVYLYESAAMISGRTNLSEIRSGEYEGFFKKIHAPGWAPDFGPSEMNAQAGATVIGARDFLVAYNINLNTTSVRRANSIAFDVRERGRVKREGHPLTGKIVKDENGNPVYLPGSLKSVKAIGWYIPEYGVAQISMNLTNIGATPVHIAFDEVCRRAEARGIRVTGSELVGLIPLHCLLEAGRYFLEKQQRSTGVSEKELIKIAVKSLGLDELAPFDPQKRIIEYLMRKDTQEKLVSMSLRDFSDETSSESPAPGGGSVSAYLGALASALTAMVANLSAHKRGWDDRWKFFSEIAGEVQQLKDKLLGLVDEDTRAFNRIMEAYAFPRGSEQEKNERAKAIQTATRYAIEIPLQVMQNSFASFGPIEIAILEGNPASISDAGVAALCAGASIKGAWLNVCINAATIKEDPYAVQAMAKANELKEMAKLKEQELLQIVEKKILYSQQ
jgi:glutamate formiminotransferase / formiminotetrahydrofolate cyclodeaminase